VPTFRRYVILLHRYFGIALSLLFVMWFVSGIAMIFARGMPSLTPEMRSERLPVLDFAAVNVLPSAAAEKAHLAGPPARAVLLTIMDRPAYRLTSRGSVTVFADNGDVLEDVGQREAMMIAARFMNLPEAKLRYAGELTQPDQWTLEDRGALPAHKVFIDDDAHTQLYISEETAEVELLTTRASRALAWVAAIPHWMYFAPLRRRGQLWRQVVIWTSGTGAVLALLGLILAFTQYPARYLGIMRWHYVTGVMFGVFSLTWVFSGMLSMEPFFWASEGGTGEGIPQALRGGSPDLSRFSNLTLPAQGIKEVEFLRIQGEPYFRVHGAVSEPLLVSADSAQIRRESFSTESLLARAAQGNADVPIAESSLLSDYDSYYHPFEGKPPLPVLRVKFADPDATWFYIDPRMSQVVMRFTRRERLQRWIYHGFHSLDFNFWYYNGPVWRVTMVALCSGGALLSMIGVVIGAKRVMATKRLKKLF